MTDDGTANIPRPGNLCRSVDGGPLMTVEHFDAVNGRVSVAWFDVDDQHNRAVLPLAAIRPATPEEVAGARAEHMRSKRFRGRADA